MIAIVHSIYSQSIALNAGLMDNDAERYCSFKLHICALGLTFLTSMYDVHNSSQGRI